MSAGELITVGVEGDQRGEDGYSFSAENLGGRY